jgi:hypothetical protein
MRAGPWEQVGPRCWTRLSPKAFDKKVAGGASKPGERLGWGGYADGWDVLGPLRDVDEARRAVDSALASMGWILG